jgi:hypothetical protein
MILALLILGYGVLNRFYSLRLRLSNITDAGQQEKSDIKRTLDQASHELTRLFSQEQRSRNLLPALQDYLLKLTADDAYQASRFTAPPPQILMLPDPLDPEMSGEADATEGRRDRYARGFPEWTPWPPTRAPQLPGQPSPP